MLTKVLFLVIFGIIGLVWAGLRESKDITERAPSAPPTTDAYQGKERGNDDEPT